MIGQNNNNNDDDDDDNNKELCCRSERLSKNSVKPLSNYNFYRVIWNDAIAILCPFAWKGI